MTIKSEWELLKKIKNIITLPGIDPNNNLITGIGDDCAVYKMGNKRYALFTTDISIESKHFTIDTTTPENIGYKAMMGNLSDIAAMGGSPKLAFISMGIPDYINEKFILSIYMGFNEACRSSKTIIAGGDTSGSGQLVINILVYGETEKNNPVLRSGARSGDIIYLTGSTGDSKAGLDILSSGKKKLINEFKSLVQKHQRPDCRLNLVDNIIDNYSPTSMIDVSDGLMSDLWQICRASNTGFKIDSEKIPISNDLKDYSGEKSIDPLDFALKSGEEYELLFTSSKKINKKLFNKGGNNIAITPIGEIVKNGYFLDHKDKIEKIKINGFDHFKE